MSAPARDLPLGMLVDVDAVLARYGLHAPIVEVMTALAGVIRRTPVRDGGRLRLDGTVDRDDLSVPA